MNTRFAFLAGDWLLSAAVGLLVLHPMVVSANEDGPVAQTQQQPDTAPQPLNPRGTVSAKPVPGTPSASEPAGPHPEGRHLVSPDHQYSHHRVVKPQVPQARSSRRYTSRPAPPSPWSWLSDLVHRIAGPPHVNSDAYGRRLAARGMTRSAHPVIAPSASVIQRTGQQVAVSPAPTKSSQASEKSPVLKRLEQLYSQDGMQAPSMNLSDLPKTPDEARLAAESRDLQRKRHLSPPAGLVVEPESSSSRPGLLQRLFSFIQTERRPVEPRMNPRISRHIVAGQASGSRAVHRPVPRQRISVARQEAHQDRAIQPPHQEPQNIAHKSAPNQAAQTEAAQTESVQTESAGTESVEAETAQTEAAQTKVADKQHTVESATVGSAEGQEPGEQTTASAAQDITIIPASQEPFPNPFPEVSEAEADAQGSPFTKLTLSEDETQIGSQQAAKTAEGEADETSDTIPDDSKLKQIAARKDMPGFKGFCPVALRDDRDLIDSQTEFSSIYESKTYYFSTSDAKARFDANPTKYAPAHQGIDVVQLSQDDSSVEGSLEHAVWYKDRLYFFSSADNMQAFVAEPAKYVPDNDGENAAE